jgi:hypothetical protein
MLKSSIVIATRGASFALKKREPRAVAPPTPDAVVAQAIERMKFLRFMSGPPLPLFVRRRAVLSLIIYPETEREGSEIKGRARALNSEGSLFDDGGPVYYKGLDSPRS